MISNHNMNIELSDWCSRTMMSRRVRGSSWVSEHISTQIIFLPAINPDTAQSRAELL